MSGDHALVDELEHAPGPAQRVRRVGGGHGEPDGEAPVEHRRLQHGVPLRGERTGDEEVGLRRAEVGEDVGGEPRLGVLGRGRAQRDHRDLVGHLPTRLLAQVVDRGVVERGAGQEQVQESSSHHLAARARPRLHVPLQRQRFEFPDVGEQRLGEGQEQFGREVEAAAQGLRAAQRDPRAEAVRALEGVEVAALVRLDAAEFAKQFVAARGGGPGVGDAVDEAVEALLDPLPDRRLVRTVEQPRVLREGAGHLDPDLLDQSGDLGPHDPRELPR